MALNKLLPFVALNLSELDTSTQFSELCGFVKLVMCMKVHKGGFLCL